MLKHLTPVPLHFGMIDNPYKVSRESISDILVNISNALAISIDRTQLTDQQYLNYLHRYFENRIGGGNEWMDYNQAIHLLETFNRGEQKEKKVRLWYGNNSNPLTRRYQFDELTNMQLNFRAGDCFVEFSELGKTPYHYWRDQEPDDIAHLCELASPMVKLNFKIVVALDNINFTPCDLSNFENWFDQYRDTWCQHWQIPYWTISQMQGGILIGRIADLEKFKEDLNQGHNPKFICNTSQKDLTL
jgi:hypothetical protein